MSIVPYSDNKQETSSNQLSRRNPLSGQEREKITDLYLQGISKEKIAQELGICRQTVARVINANATKINSEVKTYSERLRKARDKALDNLVESTGIDPVKEFAALDQAVERHHKIAAGYYIDIEKLKIIQSKFVQVVCEEVKDAETRKRIADRLAKVELPQ